MSFLSFLCWCHVCLILCDLCSLVLALVHMKEQRPLSVFIDWFQQIKTFFCWVSELRKLTLGSQSSGAEARSWGCCRVCSGVCGWQACYQRFRQAWDDETLAPLSIGLVLGQGSASRCTDSGPVTRFVDGCGSCQVPWQLPR